MSLIKIISFDLEGTLTTPDFSQAVWYEGIPSLYSKRNNITLEEARAIIDKQYQVVGDKRLDWYDIKYWFSLFDLGEYQKILENYAGRVSQYPDVIPALSALEKEYKLMISTNSAREFLPYLLKGIEKYFHAVVSSVSDYHLIKCPEFYIKLSQEMGVETGEIAHVGDSREFDLIAAKDAGLKAFHLDRNKKSIDCTHISDLMDLKGKL